MANFIILYFQDLKTLKDAYQALQLPPEDTHFLFIIDTLTHEEQQSFVHNVNIHLDYSCQMNTSTEKDILKNIQYMSGQDGDDVYILKNGTTIKKTLNLSAQTI
ncbi:MAG TPA: hypothetical protein VFE88_03215 [Candidatus Nanoarchaeia archaeon]|nr:hypothetical protein [Candidatus Nanoarchaeia archaeon]